MEQRRIFGWEAIKDGLALDFKHRYAMEKLTELGFDVTTQPKSKGGVIVNRIMDMIDSAKEERPWIVLLSDNVLFLENMQTIIPVALSLTYNLSVATIDPIRLSALIKDGISLEEDDDRILERLTAAGLVVFNNVDDAPKSLQYHHNTLRSWFRYWLRPNKILLMTGLSSPKHSLEQVQDLFLVAVENHYGPVLHEAVARRAEWFIYNSTTAVQKKKPIKVRG